MIYDLAYGDELSVTLKDDGKLLLKKLLGQPRGGPQTTCGWKSRFRCPTVVPAQMTRKPDLIPLFKVIGRGTGDASPHLEQPQRPDPPRGAGERGAIGPPRLPSYTVQVHPDGDLLDLDGRRPMRGTALSNPRRHGLRDPTIPGLGDGTVLDQIGANFGGDLEEGLPNAYYTTMDREPFEAGSDPRWHGKDADSGPPGG